MAPSKMVPQAKTVKTKLHKNNQKAEPEIESFPAQASSTINSGLGKRKKIVKKRKIKKNKDSSGNRDKLQK